MSLGANLSAHLDDWQLEGCVSLPKFYVLNVLNFKHSFTILIFLDFNIRFVCVHTDLHLDDVNTQFLSCFLDVCFGRPLYCR